MSCADGGSGGRGGRRRTKRSSPRSSRNEKFEPPPRRSARARTGPCAEAVLVEERLERGRGRGAAGARRPPPRRSSRRCRLRRPWRDPATARRRERVTRRTRAPSSARRRGQPSPGSGRRPAVGRDEPCLERAARAARDAHPARDRRAVPEQGDRPADAVPVLVDLELDLDGAVLLAQLELGIARPRARARDEDVPVLRRGTRRQRCCAHRRRGDRADRLPHRPAPSRRLL